MIALDTARLDGRKVVASISGGKDSAAMSLALTEAGIEHERVFMDTGWEHPWTYEYLRGPLAAKLGPITEIRAPLLFQDLIRRKGMFPSRLRRWCTSELKVRPMQTYLRGIDCDAVSAVGIRSAESVARSTLPEWEWSDGFDCEVWRPILRWTEADVVGIHRRYGLTPNPLYLRGAPRVGCFPCIFSRKAEIRLVVDLWPERIAEIRTLEAEATAKARARGAPEKDLPRTFFHGLNQRAALPVPIDDVVAWAKTARGGRQLLLLDTEPPGCMRWGLCESAGHAPWDAGGK